MPADHRSKQLLPWRGVDDISTTLEAFEKQPPRTNPKDIRYSVSSTMQPSHFKWVDPGSHSWIDHSLCLASGLDLFPAEDGFMAPPGSSIDLKPAALGGFRGSQGDAAGGSSRPACCCRMESPAQGFGKDVFWAGVPSRFLQTSISGVPQGFCQLDIYMATLSVDESGYI